MPPLDIPPPDDMLKLIEAASLLKCHPATVHRWIHTGKLPAWRRVGVWMVSKADCLAMFRKGAKTPVCKPEQRPQAQKQTAVAVDWLRSRGLTVN